MDGWCSAERRVFKTNLEASCDEQFRQVLKTMNCGNDDADGNTSNPPSQRSSQQTPCKELFSFL